MRTYLARRLVVTVIVFLCRDAHGTSNELFIAVCGLEGHRTYGVLSEAKVSVREEIRGTFTKQMFLVQYMSKTRGEPLPTNAIYILTASPYHPGEVFYVIGQDAKRGILDDTPASRQLVEHSSGDDLQSTPKNERIPKEVAESLMLNALIENNEWDKDIHIKATVRYPFGWKVLYERESNPYNLMCITVGDDCELKDYPRDVVNAE